MAITINNLQTLRSETNGTAFTLSNYAATAGTNRLLLVRVHAMRTAETVDLTVEAVNSQGGRRFFTARDYPEFTVDSPSAVEFFKFFTKDERV